jgi:acetylornithine deacetylase/succinyl-diaminopimelate desuccinylase-like protein
MQFFRRSFSLSASASLVLGLSVLLVSGGCPALAATPPDFEKASAEATEYLSKYLQIDTTNPPGNEKLGADYLAKILRNNGIEAEVIPTGEENRASVCARLKGNGKKKGIVLLNHIDVVPAAAKDWRHAPFNGEIHDGELWGRGALDMKNMGIAELEAMLLLKRSGVTLDRDIIFLGTPDEEVGGAHGARWVKENRPDTVKDAEFLLNEGFHIVVGADGKPMYWGVDVAEKSVLWLRITAKGDAGHASVPRRDSAPNRLVEALNRLVNSPVEFTILPVVQQFFRDIAATSAPELRDAYRNLTKAAADPKESKLLMKDKQLAAMLRNTVSLTVLKSGYKTNVIPAEASAELDCRLLPDVKPEEFIAHIKQILADPSLDVSIIEWEHAGPSSADTELFNGIKSVAAKDMPGVPVVPVVAGWFTDTHWFRELGLTGYGFEPFLMDQEHLESVHGKNERIQVAEFGKGVRRLYEILWKMSVSE